MYLEEEDSSRIVEITDNNLDMDLDLGDRPADPYLCQSSQLQARIKPIALYQR